jgi:hypothetical protein
MTSFWVVGAQERRRSDYKFLGGMRPRAPPLQITSFWVVCAQERRRSELQVLGGGSKSAAFAQDDNFNFGY